MSPGLRYHPCPEQRAMAEMFAESLHGLLPLEGTHARRCEDAALWAELEGIGLFGIGREEAAGGAGLGAAEEALIAMELGRRLVSPSVLATIGAEALSRRIFEITDLACERLQGLGAVIHSDRSPEHKSGIVVFDFPGRDLQAIRQQCLERGVVLSFRGGLLRISPHGYNNSEDIERLVDALELNHA